jgi:hypothetical protein
MHPPPQGVSLHDVRKYFVSEVSVYRLLKANDLIASPACYIIAGKLRSRMKAQDVTDTLELALQASGIDAALVLHRPRLLPDNGSSYLSAILAERPDDRKM